MELLEMDEFVLDVLFLAANRINLSESLQMVPANEMKSYEELKTYIAKYPQEKDIAWSDAFPGASAWLHDRERERKEREKREAEQKSNSNFDNMRRGKNFSLTLK